MCYSIVAAYALCTCIETFCYLCTKCKNVQEPEKCPHFEPRKNVVPGTCTRHISQEPYGGQSQMGNPQEREILMARARRRIYNWKMSGTILSTNHPNTILIPKISKIFITHSEYEDSTERPNLSTEAYRLGWSSTTDNQYQTSPPFPFEGIPIPLPSTPAPSTAIPPNAAYHQQRDPMSLSTNKPNRY
ncbi:hypothetical protein K504DRAFT_9940 [Pleomassaria siparia CBS 279.74]|uniref:Uncharacterized protein n=1 Tax=Pleomassaria siparia CBS 279.74 TaxID=1314801 RepID=A0A6G1KQL6_9PLEO|nr:hypothetical protein K504DRAFT_9940 [Pleomassaria siparia CBS 279.74]